MRIPIVRENAGFLVAIIIIVLIRLRRQLAHSIKKITAYGRTYWRRVGPTLIYSSPAVAVDNSAGSSNRVFHFRRRLFGTEYFVVQSAPAASALADSAEYFENMNLASRILPGSRGSSPGSIKRFHNAIQTYIDAYDEAQKWKAQPLEDGSPATLSEGTGAAADKAYHKFATTGNLAKGEENYALRWDSHLWDEAALTNHGPESRRQQESVSGQKLENSSSQHLSHKWESNFSHTTYETSTKEEPKKPQVSSIDTNLSGKAGATWQLLEPVIRRLRSCIKELVVLLEAKANRRNRIDIREFSYRHAVNILGVCFFGKSIEELTSSGCDFYVRFEKLRNAWLKCEQGGGSTLFGGLFKRSAVSERSSIVKEVFQSAVADLVDGKGEGGESLLGSLIRECQPMEDSRDELVETLSAFVAAFSICSVEALAGTISIILHQLSQDTDLQEKIRDKDRVEFTLEGLPCLDDKFLSEPLYIDSLIKETFKAFAVEPLVRLRCLRAYRIPHTGFRVNPESVVLIPANVNQRPQPSAAPPAPQQHQRRVDRWRRMENEYAFIADPQKRSFFVLVDQFVGTCSRVTLACVIQAYEFESAIAWKGDGYGSSCRFSALPGPLPLRMSRIEKRGKVVVFAESLRAFHASRASSFLSIIGL